MKHLLTHERHALIAGRLREDGRVIAGDLAALFGLSEDTVRRDLRDMAAAGLCRRVYGGALPMAPQGGSLDERATQAVDRKAALGRALACTILPGSCVFIDAGSTNLAVAKALPENAGITAVTHAPAIACQLLQRAGVEVVLIGGRLDAGTGACLGPWILRDLERFRLSTLVLGACGIDAQGGITAHGLDDAEVKAAIASRSAEVLVAATTDKLGTAAPYRVLSTARLTRLFVEADCDEANIAAFTAVGVDVVRAGGDREPLTEARRALPLRRKSSAGAGRPMLSLGARP